MMSAQLTESYCASQSSLEKVKPIGSEDGFSATARYLEWFSPLTSLLLSGITWLSVTLPFSQVHLRQLFPGFMSWSIFYNGNKIWPQHAAPLCFFVPSVPAHFLVLSSSWCPKTDFFTWVCNASESHTMYMCLIVYMCFITGTCRT